MQVPIWLLHVAKRCKNFLVKDFKIFGKNSGKQGGSHKKYTPDHNFVQRINHQHSQKRYKECCCKNSKRKKAARKVSTRNWSRPVPIPNTVRAGVCRSIVIFSNHTRQTGSHLWVTQGKRRVICFGITWLSGRAKAKHLRQNQNRTARKSKKNIWFDGGSLLAIVPLCVVW